MKKLLMFAMVSATLGLTGCYDASSPTSVVESAGYAIHTNDLAKFRANLTSDMKASYYGTQAGLDYLRNRFQGQNLQVTQATAVRSAACGGNCTDTGYSVVVTNSGSAAATVYLNCRTQYRDGHKTMKWRETRCLINGLSL